MIPIVVTELPHRVDIPRTDRIPSQVSQEAQHLVHLQAIKCRHSQRDSRDRIHRLRSRTTTDKIRIRHRVGTQTLRSKVNRIRTSSDLECTGGRTTASTEDRIHHRQDHSSGLVDKDHPSLVGHRTGIDMVSRINKRRMLEDHRTSRIGVPWVIVGVQGRVCRAVRI